MENQIDWRSSKTITDTIWHHIAVTFDESDSTGCKIYIDGADYTTGNTGTLANVDSLANTNVLAIGAETDVGDPFDGQLDEVRVYNYARSASQIKQDYNNNAVNFN